MNTQKHTFLSHGKQCAATLHLPQVAVKEGLPSIMMVHGWGATQLMLITEFIRRFNEAGFAVLTFDYPGWGDSEGANEKHGTQRHVINPWQRQQTVEDALAFFKTLPEVDADKLVLWGSSFGGGHTVAVAAKHPELKAAIAHVPMLDGFDAAAATPFRQMLRLAGAAARDVFNPRSNVYVPIVAPDGGFASMSRDNAWRAYTWVQENLGEEYDNELAARSILGVGFYRPIRSLKKLRVPTLLIPASNDSVAPFNEKKVARLAPSCVQVHVLQGDHFDPYFEPLFNENIEVQLAFLGEVFG